MTPTIDAIQTLLSLSGAALFAAWFIMLAIGRVVFVIASRAASIGIAGMAHVIAFTRHLLHFKINLAAVVFASFKISVVAFLLSFFSQPVKNGLQYIEQAFVSPVYFTPDTSSATQAAYEAILARNVGRNEYNAIMSETQYLASKYGSSVLAFLQVYHAECGLNPYVANVTKSGDTVAIGLIQFTAAGVSGIASWQETKQRIKNRDVQFMLQLQRAYFERAARCAMPRPCDVYTAVFMPSFICAKSDDTVLASVDSSKPQWYYQNPSLDGYKIDSKGRIFVGNAYRDGKITKQDLALKLEYLRQQVAKQ